MEGVEMGRGEQRENGTEGEVIGGRWMVGSRWRVGREGKERGIKKGCSAGNSKDRL